MNSIPILKNGENTKNILGRRIHVIYRTWSGENRKGRPEYYSKDLALNSLLLSLSRLDIKPDITFLNDGMIPKSRLYVMEKHGEVISKDKLGSAGSMRAALEIVERRTYSATDLVFLAEDDHLYRDIAFNQLNAAASLFPEADYFGLYASIGERGADGKTVPAFAHVPLHWTHGLSATVDGHLWCRGLSTTSTFGARPQALKQDIPLMRLIMKTDGAWDHTTCLMYQGYLPFSWKKLELHFGDEASWRRQIQSYAIRTGLNSLGALRRVTQRPRHILIAADPPLATHLETEHLAIGTDWSLIAAQCRTL